MGRHSSVNFSYRSSTARLVGLETRARDGGCGFSGDACGRKRGRCAFRAGGKAQGHSLLRRPRHSRRPLEQACRRRCPGRFCLVRRTGNAAAVAVARRKQPLALRSRSRWWRRRAPSPPASRSWIMSRLARLLRSDDTLVLSHMTSWIQKTITGGKVTVGTTQSEVRSSAALPPICGMLDFPTIPARRLCAMHAAR